MTNNPHTADRILGSLGSAEGRGIVRMEDRFDTDIDDVWSALTDPSRLAHWYGEIEGDIRLGGEYHAHFTPADGKAPGGSKRASLREGCWCVSRRRTSRMSRRWRSC